MTYRHGFTQALALAACIAMLCLPADPQSAQKGADAKARGRVMRLTRDGFLAAEPYDAGVEKAYRDLYAQALEDEHREF